MFCCWGRSLIVALSLIVLLLILAHAVLPGTILSQERPMGPEAPPTEVAIAYTGETHAMIEPCSCPVEPLGGVARRAHQIKALRQESGDLLVLDGGGCFAKGIYDEYTQGDELDKQRTFVALKAMAQMNYDAVCLGDDEFAFGQGAIKWAEKELGLAFVSCNVQTEAGQPFVTPYVTKRIGGQTVLITGVCTPEVALGDYWEQFQGLAVFDPVKSVTKLLREQKGKVDIVILLSHLCEEESEKLAKEVPGIDLVFNSGRRTSTKRYFDVGQTRIVNFDYQGQNLIVARIRPAAGQQGDRFTIGEIPLGNEVPDDPEAARLVNEFAKVRESGTVLPTVRLDLYMMSFCPHSKPAFQTLFQIKKALGEAIDPHAYYLVRFNDEGKLDALYGEDEVQEDRRRVCILRTQEDKFLSYVACRDSSVEGTSWEECASSVGIDTQALSECLKSEYPERELKSMAARAARLRVSASPTLYVNNRRFNEPLDRTLLLRSVCSVLGPRAQQIPVCKDLPKCLYDYDCPQKDKMVARCLNPGTKDAECVYDEAVKVHVWVLYDANAVATNEDKVINSTKVMMPGLEVEKVEASTEEGRRLIETYQIEYLPGYIFGMEAQRERNFVHLKSAFKKVNDRLVFRADLSGGSIAASRPVIRGKIDVFISATAKAGLEGLAEMIKLRNEGKLSYPFETHHILYRDEKGELHAPAGLSELQEAQRQAAMLMQDGNKFDEYILLRGKEPDNSYWEEPIRKVGFEPAAIKELSAFAAVRSKLESDAKLCEELRIGGALLLLIDNREVVPIASSKMLVDILEKLAQRHIPGPNTK